MLLIARLNVPAVDQSDKDLLLDLYTILAAQPKWVFLIDDLRSGVDVDTLWNVKGGVILGTSRESPSVLSLSAGPLRLVDLQPLPPKESRKLFLSVLPVKFVKSAVVPLAELDAFLSEQLGRVPLILQLAGSVFRNQLASTPDAAAIPFETHLSTLVQSFTAVAVPQSEHLADLDACSAVVALALQQLPALCTRYCQENQLEVDSTALEISARHLLTILSSLPEGQIPLLLFSAPPFENDASFHTRVSAELFLDKIRLQLAAIVLALSGLLTRNYAPVIEIDALGCVSVHGRVQHIELERALKTCSPVLAHDSAIWSSFTCFITTVSSRSIITHFQTACLPILIHFWNTVVSQYTADPESAALFSERLSVDLIYHSVEPKTSEKCARIAVAKRRITAMV